MIVCNPLGLACLSILRPFLVLATATCLRLHCKPVSLVIFCRSFENHGPNHSNALWWEVMESFSHEQRSQVLKFVTGRSRLPVAFKVEWQPDSDRLPRAATCFQKIYLPRYPSFSKMREKMLVAIQCMSIDTD